MPRAPGLAVALSDEIEHELGKLGGLTPRVECLCQAATCFNVFQDHLTHQDGYGILDFQITSTTRDERVALALDGWNLIDESYFTTVIRFDGQFGNVAYVGSPRTVGISSRVEF